MNRTLSTVRPSRAILTWAIVVGVAMVLACGAWFTRDRWLLRADADGETPRSSKGLHDAVNHSDHGHGHSTGNTDSIVVSATGLKNIGFKPVTVALKPFERTEAIPAIVIEQPGTTQIHVTAPVTGILTEILMSAGQAVEPASKMFEIRITDEELVAAQQDYLKTVESLNVVDRELTRLQAIGEGVVAGKLIIEQQYEKQKLEASLRAAEQALLMHGLTEQQIARILKTRQLLRAFTVRAPARVHPGDAPEDHWFHVQRLSVSPGQQIEAGQELGVLADHCELFVEGRAFEDDAARLRQAAREGWTVSAKPLNDEPDAATVENLKLLYLADHVDPDSRAFRFYLPLPNEVALTQETPEGRRFIEWRFKPGQRMELSVPVERWKDRIVLPVEAVIEEGAENFVYRQNGKSFERVPVHVEYRDGKQAVVAQDGALFPGDIVAGSGAYQLHLQLKNRSGSGIDPHAGHNH